MYEVLKHEKILETEIFDVYQDEVILERELPVKRTIIEHIGAAAVAPIDDDGKIFFVRQYRHAAKARVLEIPAGTLSKGESPELCALRELEEEIGYKTDSVVFLNKIYPAIGYSTEVVYLYYAKNLVKTAQNLDPDEYILVEKYSADEALELIKSGEIMDSKTISAILLYKYLSEF
jgi:ADP-ribose pyrophosphatase